MYIRENKKNIRFRREDVEGDWRGSEWGALQRRTWDRVWPLRVHTANKLTWALLWALTLHPPLANESYHMALLPLGPTYGLHPSLSILNTTLGVMLENGKREITCFTIFGTYLQCLIVILSPSCYFILHGWSTIVFLPCVKLVFNKNLLPCTLYFTLEKNIY